MVFSIFFFVGIDILLFRPAFEDAIFLILILITVYIVSLFVITLDWRAQRIQQYKKEVIDDFFGEIKGLGVMKAVISTLFFVALLLGLGFGLEKFTELRQPNDQAIAILANPVLTAKTEKIEENLESLKSQLAAENNKEALAEIEKEIKSVEDKLLNLQYQLKVSSLVNAIQEIRNQLNGDAAPEKDNNTSNPQIMELFWEWIVWTFFGGIAAGILGSGVNSMLIAEMKTQFPAPVFYEMTRMTYLARDEIKARLVTYHDTPRVNIHIQSQRRLSNGGLFIEGYYLVPSIYGEIRRKNEPEYIYKFEVKTDIWANVARLETTGSMRRGY